MANHRKEQNKCLVRDCPRIADASRGLCKNCYAIAQKLVQGKRTTWERLVSLGLCRQAKPHMASPFTHQLRAAVYAATGKAPPVRKIGPPLEPPEEIHDAPTEDVE